MARILVIDDEGNIRLMIRLALQYAGHEVETAADGLEGLEKFGLGQGWDVVFLDQRMPGMDGLEVLRTIRQRDPDARAIMITAFGTIDLAVEAMRAGARDFLRKPFTAEALRGAVVSVLEGQPPVTERPQPKSKLSFSMSTINGFWIDSDPTKGVRISGGLQYPFRVVGPDRHSYGVTVFLPAYFLELVKAHADLDNPPGGNRFWHGLAEEALANYLWQHSEAPAESELRIEDLTAGLQHWVDAVVATNG